MGFYNRVQLCAATWRHDKECVRVRAERRRVRDELRKSFEALCDLKCRALKKTGVFGTEHENLEAAIVQLAHALDDYRDGA